MFSSVKNGNRLGAYLILIFYEFQELTFIFYEFQERTEIHVNNVPVARITKQYILKNIYILGLVFNSILWDFED